MTPSTILRKAARRLSKEGTWTQGAYALDANGDSIDPGMPNAVCWRVGGAIIREADSGSSEWAALEALANYLGVSNLTAWNDAPERTQAEVVQALNAAADLAEGA